MTSEMMYRQAGGYFLYVGCGDHVSVADVPLAILASCIQPIVQRLLHATEHTWYESTRPSVSSTSTRAVGTRSDAAGPSPATCRQSAILIHGFETVLHQSTQHDDGLVRNPTSGKASETVCSCATRHAPLTEVAAASSTTSSMASGPWLGLASSA